MPGCSGELVVTTSCAFLFLHARLRVQRAPGIPCALSRGPMSATQLGRFHAARSRRCVYVCEDAKHQSCHCEERKRRSNPPASCGTMDCFAGPRNDGENSSLSRLCEEHLRRSNPSSIWRCRAMDCFAALAMTGKTVQCLVIARSTCDEAIHLRSGDAEPWIASLALAM